MYLFKDNRILFIFGMNGRMTGEARQVLKVKEHLKSTIGVAILDQHDGGLGQGLGSKF